MINDSAKSMIKSLNKDLYGWKIDFHDLSKFKEPISPFISIEDLQKNKYLRPFYSVVDFALSDNASWFIIDLLNVLSKGYPYFVLREKSILRNKIKIFNKFLIYPRSSSHFKTDLLDLSRLILGEDDKPILPVLIHRDSKFDDSEYSEYLDLRILNIFEFYQKVKCQKIDANTKVEDFIDSFALEDNNTKLNELWSRLCDEWGVNSRIKKYGWVNPKIRFGKYLIWLNYLDDDWKYYFYIPGVVLDRDVYKTRGGLAIAFNNKPKVETLILLQQAVSRILEIWTRLYTDLFNYISNINVAIAAIMSRNSSHNIGSHVLSRIATKGINGWTEGLALNEILNTYLDIGNYFDNKKDFQSKIAPEWINKVKENIKNLLKEPFRWSKDVQYLARYIQQRMDFIAQISTEWPQWSESAYLLKDLLRWFLHQKHLLNYIAASENLGAALFDEKTSLPIYNRKESDVEGDIRLHVFMIPEELWESKVRSSNDIFERFQIRRGQLFQYCYNYNLCRNKDNNKDNKDPCDDCHCVLLEMPDNTPPIVNYELDIPIAVPGGSVVGAHAFYVIIENIIRNAAKHGFLRCKKEMNHLDIFIEILYDPDEEIQIVNGQDRNPAFLFRIYDNVSRVAGNNADGVTLWGEGSINEKLGTALIDETGKLRKENWGLAEMKIVSGYLQRRQILNIGEEREKIVGNPIEPNGEENFVDLEMLRQGKNGAEAIIRAVESPIGTLGYEFYIPKPRTIGAVCSEPGNSFKE